MRDAPQSTLQKLLARPQSRWRKVLEWAFVFWGVAFLVNPVLVTILSFIPAFQVAFLNSFVSFLGHWVLAIATFALPLYLAFLRIGIDLVLRNWFLKSAGVFGVTALTVAVVSTFEFGFLTSNSPTPSEATFASLKLNGLLSLITTSVQILWTWHYLRRFFQNAWIWPAAYIFNSSIVLLTTYAKIKWAFVWISNLDPKNAVDAVATFNAWSSPLLSFIGCLVLSCGVVLLLPREDLAQKVESE